MMNMIVFLLSQTLLVHTDLGFQQGRPALFVARCLLYFVSLGRMVRQHFQRIVRACLRDELEILFGFLPVPNYLDSWQEFCKFLIMCGLLVMLSTEPFLHCAYLFK